jgi:hypothetical protein
MIRRHDSMTRISIGLVFIATGAGVAFGCNGRSEQRSMRGRAMPERVCARWDAR